MSDPAESKLQTLAAKVVAELFERRHSPVPGSILKPALMKELGKTGQELDLKSLSFVNFAKSIPGVSVQIRPGSDFLVTPNRSTDLLEAFTHSLPIVRRDLWRAFVEFESEATNRFYDSDLDKVVYTQSTIPPGGILIEPIKVQTQMEWRRIFANAQPDPLKSELLEILTRAMPSALSESSRKLRENGSALFAWNRFLQKKVTDEISSWASKNDLPAERWESTRTLSGERKVSQSNRAGLYELLDLLPTEDLEKIQIPLGLLLKIRSKI